MEAEVGALRRWLPQGVRARLGGGLWARIAVIVAVIGPGVITANVDNDAGGITTY